MSSPDERAAAWLETHQKDLRRIAYSGAQWAGDDALQEASVVILGMFREGREVSTGYLLSVAFKVAQDIAMNGRRLTGGTEHRTYEPYRTRARNVSLVHFDAHVDGSDEHELNDDPSLAQEDDDLEEIEAWAAVASIVRNLKPSHRTIAMGKAVGESTVEIGQRLGLGTSAVNKQWRAARQQLLEEVAA